MANQLDNELIEAAKANKLAKVKQLATTKGINLDAQDFNGDTSLLIAVKLRNEAMVKFLIKAGASLDISNKNQISPYIAAELLNDLNLMRILEDAELNDNVMNLHKAAFNGNLDEVERLIDLGVDVNAARKKDDATALLFAVQKGHADIVTFLITEGANLNVTPKGAPLIAIAAQENHLKVAKILLKHHADPNIIYHNISSPLRIAVQLDHIAMVKLLLEYGGNANAKFADGHNLLLSSIGNNNYEMVKLLIDNKADVNFVDIDGVKPIVLAATMDNIEIIKLLHKAGASAEKIATEGSFCIPLGTKEITNSPAIDGEYRDRYVNCSAISCKESIGMYWTKEEYLTTHDNSVIVNSLTVIFDYNRTAYSVLDESSRSYKDLKTALLDSRVTPGYKIDDTNDSEVLSSGETAIFTLSTSGNSTWHYDI